MAVLEQQVQARDASLAGMEQACAQQVASFQAQLEQVKFALAQRDKQLQESGEALANKDVQVKSLLQHLAALGSGEAADQGDTTDAETSNGPSKEATIHEVMFALEGPLGLEFERLQAPYVVEQVHASGIASGLGVAPGDELVAVGDASVEEAPWNELVQCLSSRPVVARFRRDPTRLETAEVAGP